MTSLFLESGSLFSECYEIETLIRRGGFSAVYRAIDTRNARRVALKVFALEETTLDLDHHREAQRFEQEFEIISALNHPATIEVYEFGVARDGTLFMTMEFFKGEPLDRLMASKKLPVEIGIRLLHDLLEALQEAHQKGVIHRDIKPANIMVHLPLRESEDAGIEVDQIEIRLLDFGIAKLIHTEDKTILDLTQTGFLVGTPRYMSPEQIEGLPLGPNSDLYSLGLVVYELLLGEPAIGGRTPVQIIQNHLTTTSIELPDTLGLPPSLVRTLKGMLRKETQERTASAAAALRDLRAPAPTKKPAGSVQKRVLLSLAFLALLFLLGALLLFVPSQDSEDSQHLDDRLARTESLKTPASNPREGIPSSPQIDLRKIDKELLVFEEYELIFEGEDQESEVLDKALRFVELALVDAREKGPASESLPATRASPATSGASPAIPRTSSLREKDSETSRPTRVRRQVTGPIDLN